MKKAIEILSAYEQNFSKHVLKEIVPNIRMVMQQLAVNQDLGVYYYTNERNSCEVDFIVDNGDDIIPLEVKAENNLKAKSLKTYREKFKPNLSIRSSMSDYSEEPGFINLPLYAIDGIE